MSDELKFYTIRDAGIAELNVLVEKWRKISKLQSDTDPIFAVCADELEAALSALTGRWSASICAQQYREYPQNVPPCGRMGQFFVCELGIAAVDASRFTVTDSGGRPIMKMGAMIP